ncbi:Fcf2-domain-containing protein [Coniophora puteana RWD-64-598 SS2]|uniref:Fcf2-domain-containing protein n=1 Tax=Coniophora puteana (strain RWD-64-598) TaxID=741705 RepID=A0A5M3MP42_CONPW|nr:Fcf2-domain-containing protein [Coniophora puteana RWD-64-598 SS2]EIW80939.1 Fcf2-domain-containing protein [Coniophora puteana RWD-64-598 SS2]
MASLSTLDKGKQKEIIEHEEVADSDSEVSSVSSVSTDSDSDSDSDSDEEITPEYLESLLNKARQTAREAAETRKSQTLIEQVEEEVIKLDGTDEEPPLPPLDPGALPPSYFKFGEKRHEPPREVRDPDVERVTAATASVSQPAPPPAVPDQKLTKKERKALKNKTAGAGWFDLPAPAEADLPRLYREVEALRLRNQLDPKRFYRRDEGEGKGIKGLPKHFAIGTIMPTDSPFGGASADNLARAQRKRTFVDELLDDAESKHYAKKKFQELQTVRGARGRNTLHNKNAKRKPKW